MAKGPIVTDSIKIFIADIYKKHPKWKAKEVRNVASSLLHDDNPELPVSFPSLSTVQNVLATIRKPKPIDPEDKPWSIGKSVQFNLSPEATADLLQIWAFCLAVGREFTIRQAKWACYLRTTSYSFFTPNNKLETYELYNLSTLYANRERISKALNNPDIDTSDLDVVLGLTHVEYTAALTTGLLDNSVFHGFPRELPEVGIKEVKKIAEAYGDIVTELLPGGDARDDVFIDALDIPEEADRIFAYWLRYIGKSPQWGKFSRTKKRKIILKLKNNIEAEAKIKVVDNAVFSSRNWKPTEVLKAVGYEINDIKNGGSK